MYLVLGPVGVCQWISELFSKIHSENAKPFFFTLMKLAKTKSANGQTAKWANDELSHSIVNGRNFRTKTAELSNVYDTSIGSNYPWSNSCIVLNFEWTWAKRHTRVPYTHTHDEEIVSEINATAAFFLYFVRLFFCRFGKHTHIRIINQKTFCMCTRYNSENWKRKRRKKTKKEKRYMNKKKKKRWDTNKAHQIGYCYYYYFHRYNIFMSLLYCFLFGLKSALLRISGIFCN